jgi:Ulp1 family protease
MRQFVTEEYFWYKNNRIFDFTGWEDVPADDSPYQVSGWDCGNFVCGFLENFSRNVTEMRFCQSDIVDFKIAVATAILNADTRT